MAAQQDETDDVFTAACETGEMTVLRLKTACDPAIVNRKDADGTPPLWRATAWARTEVVEFLLENGADPSLADKHGETAADLAGRLNYDSIRAVIDEACQKRLQAEKTRAFRQEMETLSKSLRQFTGGLGAPVKACRPARFGKPAA